MPRNTIDISDRIDYLSILDAEGNVDTSLEPDIPPDFLKALFRAMVLGRRFDARLLNLQRQGRIGTFPPITGQEAAHLGAAAAIEPSDWMVPAFREMAAEIWRGRTLENILISLAGYNEGADVLPDQNTLPMAVPVGTQTLHAVGIAWAMRYRKTDRVAMTFFGDGATSQGDFHEALNMAGVYKAPAIFVCQNNHWAISIPRSRQTRSKTLAQKAIAYGISGIQVDGNDILAVYQAASEAVARARKGEGPSLIECVTYRMMMHTTADDPNRYRTEKEVETWREKDPITRFQKYLLAKKVLTEAEVNDMESEITAEIQSSVDKAEATMKTLTDPHVMFDHLYAEPLPRIEEEKKALAEFLAQRRENEEKEANHG
jgi:pyruvate dehydrogenase E1 component alpha subunit